MQNWSAFIEGRGNPNEVEVTLNKVVDELRSKGHEVTIARLAPHDTEAKDITKKYASSGAR